MIFKVMLIIFSFSIAFVSFAVAYPTGAGGCFGSNAADDASMFGYHHGGPLYQTSAGHGDYSLKASSQTYIPGCSYTLGLCGNMQFTGYLLYAYEKGQPAKRFGILSANELNSRSHTLNCENTQATITHSDGNLKNPNVHFTFSSQPSSNYNSTILPPSQIDFTIYVMKSNMADWYTFKTSLVLDSNWQSSQCINPPNVVCPVTQILFDPTVASASNSMANMPGMDGMDMTNSQQSTSMDMSTMNMDSPSMSMSSAFNTNWSSNTILFQQLKTSNPGYYLFSLLVIFVLSMLHEVLGIVSMKYDERLYKSKKSQLDKKLVEEARKKNDELFAEKESNRLRHERDEELNLKLQRANKIENCCGVSQSAASSTLRPLQSTENSVDEESKSLFNPIKSPTNAEAPRSTECCCNPSEVNSDSSNVPSIESDENIPINEKKLKSNIEFASKHLSLSQPSNCRTEIATVSTPLNGSSILTLSTSSCAAPEVLHFRYTKREQFNRTILYFIRTFLMMILMILFMTLDVGFVLVIMFGMSLGYFVYSNYLTSAPIGGHHLHH